MSHNIPPLEYEIPGYHNVDARIHRDSFRVQGNVQIAGDLVPINGELALGSDDHRFTTIYLHSLSGNVPSIHFGDQVFTGQDVINAQKAANALFPYDPWDGSGGVNWWTEIEPVGHPTTLTGYGITDAATDAQGSRADSVFYSVLAVSSNWNSTYGSVLATSGNWDTVYANVYDTVTELNGLDVSTGLNVGGNVTITGYVSAGDRILGPANMVIDPAAHQDNTGKLSILGDLQVGGTTTTVNQLSSNNIKSSGNVTTNTLDVTDTFTIGGRIHGPAEMYVDPAAVGDNTGKLIILGDLQVDGVTTTVNSTTVTVSGKTLVLAEGSADAAQADNSGIQIQGPDAIFKYFAADDRWKSDRQIKISRSSPALVFDKTDNGHSSVLAHDTNGLYFKVTDNGDTTRFMNAGNGTNLLINHNTHRVGINTTTPSVALHVNDTDAIKIPKGTTAERPSATTATHQGYIRYNTTTNQFEGFGAGNTWGSLGGVMDVDQDTYISPESSPGADDDTLRFFTSGLERARIDSSGKVGIGTGTNAIQQRLHVFRDPMRVSHNIGANTAYTLLNFASDRTIDDYGGVNSVYWRVNLQTPSNDHRRGDLRFGAKTNVSDSTIVDHVTFTYDGKVGIGTTNPGKQLHIVDTNANLPGIKISASDLGYEHEVRAQGDSLLISADSINYGGAGPDIRFNVSGTEHMRIQKNGYVGIGVADPTTGLHLATGHFRLQQSGSPSSLWMDADEGRSFISHNGYWGASAWRGYNSASDCSAIWLHRNDGVVFNHADAPTTDGGTITWRETFRVDPTGNIRTADQAGIITFNDTIAAAGSTTVFEIDSGHGAMAFRVNFVMNGADGESVAKTYEVVKQFAKQPISFKVIDTGPYTVGNPDMDVSFTQGATNYELVCTVTNTHSTQDVQIVTTMWLAGSPTDLTVTEF